MSRRSLLALVLLLCATLCGCPEEDNDLGLRGGAKIVEGTGTVRFVNLEGGFFAIEGDDGVTYDPRNLDPEFQVDGLKVRFVIEIVSDAGGIHMVGQLVDVLAIEVV